MKTAKAALQDDASQKAMQTPAPVANPIVQDYLDFMLRAATAEPEMARKVCDIEIPIFVRTKKEARTETTDSGAGSERKT